MATEAQERIWEYVRKLSVDEYLRMKELFEPVEWSYDCD